MSNHIFLPKITHWLNDKVKDNTISNKYTIFPQTLIPYYGEYTNEYYKKNDIDLKMNDKFYLNLINSIDENILKEDKELYELSKYIDIILIPPNTNGYHCNQLFKKIMDYSINNKLYYEINNDETNSQELIKFIDNDFKEVFYNFCYENS